MQKAEWISHRTQSSTSSRTVARTRYLQGIRQELIAIIVTYFRDQEDGIVVTLHCLNELGKERLVDIGKPTGTEWSMVKQDIGLYVAILLTEIFGESGVETYRNKDTMRGSTRSPGRVWPALTGRLPNTEKWVSRYTPHRLTARGKARLRDGLEVNTETRR